jgi:hypothetical protein
MIKVLPSVDAYMFGSRQFVGRAGCGCCCIAEKAAATGAIDSFDRGVMFLSTAVPFTSFCRVAGLVSASAAANT